MRALHWLAGAVALAATVAAAGGVDDLKTAFEAREFAGSDGGKLLYRLLRPKGYDPNKTYPLVLVLHGAGGRGGDNWGQIKDQPAPFLALAGDAVQDKHPCIVVAPQCPGGKQWVNWPWGKGSYSQDKVPISAELKRVLEALAQLRTEFQVDARRVYVTGMSMGGYGTWDIIAREPKLFAAAMPVCGAGDPSRAPSIAKMAVWAFHGDKDGVVPVSGSREMVEALKKAGGKPRYNEFPGVGHASWGPAYATERLWEWLFAQKRAE
ncbi:MAG TPA: prolyl oligopeptidase family serine peptidase [Planctomycetota bacterium]|nr:prolyl oligopeptidase family serine peptidase [Planctomycetota bacterium]